MLVCRLCVRFISRLSRLHRCSFLARRLLNRFSLSHISLAVLSFLGTGVFLGALTATLGFLSATATAMGFLAALGVAVRVVFEIIKGLKPGNHI
jgi:hypothetical protein